MSFQPVTWWALRCDGDTTRGQCTALLSFCDTDDLDGTREDMVWRVAQYEQPVLDRDARRHLRAADWHAARDGRLLCPRHVAALEHLAHAAMDGLPFPDTRTSTNTNSTERHPHGPGHGPDRTGGAS